MRQAFLIIAHNNWWQLKKLMKRLDAENHDLYIHIDKKSKGFKETDFAGVVSKSKVTFYQEYKVFWGGYSQVQVELFLFSKAKLGNYAYYHLISGADLPLKSNAEIDSFFESHYGKQFIQYDEEKLNHDPEISRRTRLYHFLQNYRRRYKQKWKNDFFTFCERLLLLLQIIVRVNRVKNLDWIVKYGSNWVSVTDDFVTVLLGQKKKIEQVFSCTNCSDELFVQTVAWNCGFKDRIYTLPTGETDNARFIDWSRGNNGNPYIFRQADYELLINQDAMFARKFSETVDKEVIQKICDASE